MNKRRLRILKFAAMSAALLLLAWGASAIAVYAVSSGACRSAFATTRVVAGADFR